MPGGTQAGTVFIALLSVFATGTPMAVGSENPDTDLVITISEIVPFEGDDDGEVGPVMQRFEDRCELGRTLADAIVEAARRKHIRIVTAPSLDHAQGKVLAMEIDSASGRRGGALSGTKSMTVRGKLRDGDTVIGTFVVRRQETSLAKSTCRALVHTAKTIAKDVAKWLKNPGMKSRLGSA